MRKLAYLRSEHPDCRILSTSIYETKFGDHVAVLEGAYLYQVVIGDFSYVSYDSLLQNVDIGNFCSIGPRVQIGLAPHPTKDFISTYPAFYSNSNTGCPMPFREDKIYNDSVPRTMIENDVWIGANVIIPGGISIGTGAVIAAGSVVVKNVPPYAIVGGNPAKIIRFRFSEEQIEYLLSSQWWSWPVEKIIHNVDGFRNIEQFKAIVD